MDKLREIFGIRLTRMVKKSGMTKLAICEGAGIGRSQLDSYMKGEVSPNLDTVEKICIAMKIGPEVLFNEPREPITQEKLDAMVENFDTQHLKLIGEARRLTELLQAATKEKITADTLPRLSPELSSRFENVLSRMRNIQDSTQIQTILDVLEGLLDSQPQSVPNGSRKRSG